MRKFALIIVSMLLLCITSVAAASVSVGDVSLSSDDEVARSNPLPEGDDNKLDDRDELEYATFGIPITATNGTVTVTDIVPDLSGFSYEPFDDEVNDSDRYVIKTSLPLNITNTTRTVTIDILVPSDLDSIDADFSKLEHSLTAQVQTSEGNEQSTLSFYVENGLELDEAVISADDDDITCDPDDDDVDLDCDDEIEEIHPRADISMELFIENVFDSDSDLDFEDVEITIDTDNSDLEPDEDREEIDIDADETSSWSTGFDADDDIEEGDDFTIEIEVTVTDENGAKHGFRHEIDLEFNLPDGVVDIDELEVMPSTVCAGDDISISFVIENQGGDDQDNVRFQLENDRLGLNKLYTGIQLDPADERDNDYSDVYSFNIRESRSAGQYSIRGTVYYEDEDGDDVSKFVDRGLTVEDCSPADNGQDTQDGDTDTGGGQDDGTTIIVTQPDDQNVSGGDVSGGPTTAQPVRATPSESDDVLFVTVIIVLIVMLGLVVACL